MLQLVDIALQRQLAAMTAPTVKVRTGDSEEPTDVMTSTPAVANNVSESTTVSTLNVIPSIFDFAVEHESRLHAYVGHPQDGQRQTGQD